MNQRQAVLGALAIASAWGIGLGATLFTVAPFGPSMLAPDQLFLAPGLGPGGPIPVGGGAGSGAGMPGDNMNAVSRRTGDLDVVVCFGVDDESEGDAPPAGTDGLPNFAVFDQAINNQAAGDAFVSTSAFNRAEGKLPPPISVGDDFHVLARNQSPEYFMDFGLLPNASPNQMVPDKTPLDDVDGETCVDDPSDIGTVFFSMSAQSPSLNNLPGPASGATIIRDPDITVGGNEQLYAGPAALGLDFFDDVDALVVHDPPNGGLAFDPMGGDFIAFSLAPGSPTLAIQGWSPADILIVDDAGLRVLAFHFELGLLPTDNLDSLAFIGLVNGSAQDTLDAIFDGVPLPCPSGQPQPIPAGDRTTLILIALAIAGAGAWMFCGRPGLR